jgi:hypothetical protein
MLTDLDNNNEAKLAIDLNLTIIQAVFRQRKMISTQNETRMPALSPHTFGTT